MPVWYSRNAQPSRVTLERPRIEAPRPNSPPSRVVPLQVMLMFEALAIRTPNGLPSLMKYVPEHRTVLVLMRKLSYGTSQVTAGPPTSTILPFATRSSSPSPPSTSVIVMSVSPSLSPTGTAYQCSVVLDGVGPYFQYWDCKGRF